jgi:hypothetical protein
MAPRPLNVKSRPETGCSAPPVDADDARLGLVDASNRGFVARVETLDDPLRVRATDSRAEGFSGSSVLRLRLFCLE